jgi:hypothetical protein
MRSNPIKQRRVRSHCQTLAELASYVLLRTTGGGTSTLEAGSVRSSPGILDGQPPEAPVDDTDPAPEFLRLVPLSDASELSSLIQGPATRFRGGPKSGPPESPNPSPESGGGPRHRRCSPAPTRVSGAGHHFLPPKPIHGVSKIAAVDERLEPLRMVGVDGAPVRKAPARGLLSTWEAPAGAANRAGLARDRMSVRLLRASATPAAIDETQ